MQFVNPFGDVKQGDWFYSDVAYANMNGLMVGTSTDTIPMLFSPNMNFTRSMAVAVLYRMAGNPNVSGLANTFTDVEEGAWYTDATKWAVANGIVSGYGDGIFGFNNNITRQDLTVMIIRYADLMDIRLPSTREYVTFSDEADIANYAKEAIERFFKAGIISGKPGNKYAPTDNATRAEVAIILHRFSQMTEE